MKKLTDGTWVPDRDEHYQELLDKSTWDTIYNYQKDRITAAMQIVKSKKLAIDVGANIGIYTHNLAKHFEKVIAIEPDSDNYKCLKANCTQHNVRLIKAAAGNKQGYVTIDTSNLNCGAYTVSESEQGDIQQITIDDMDLEHCDLIKIDVEGYEFKVLEGAWQIIQKFHPVIILEERNLLMPNRKPEELKMYEIKELIKPRRVLEDMGYMIQTRLTHDFVLGYVGASESP